MGLRYCPKTTSGSNISTQNDSAGISYKLSNRQQIKVQILTSLCCKHQYLGLITLKILQNKRMSEKCCKNNNKHNNKNSDNSLTSRRTDGGKKDIIFLSIFLAVKEKGPGFFNF